MQHEATHKIETFSNNWTIIEEISHCTCDVSNRINDVCVQSWWFGFNLCEENMILWWDITFYWKHENVKMKVMSTEIAINIPLESYHRIYNLFKTLFFDLLEFSVKKKWLLWLDFENTNTLYGIVRQRHITRKKVIIQNLEYKKCLCIFSSFICVPILLISGPIQGDQDGL